ncbi:MAG: DUF1295 domain-containing protein [Prolixibacteraceae bacterium]|nr:DUF1295 domain-containing protein [Prolixibacteraceae bacterium]
MELLPNLAFTLQNAFWFSLLYGLTNLVIMKVFPTHYKKRVLATPRFGKKTDQIIGSFNFIIFQGLILIVCFMPVKYVRVAFEAGTTFFILGYIAYVMSLINYAKTNPDKPVTKGIYRYSRNPQQLSTIVMWVGIGFITACWLIVFLCLFQLILVFPTFIAQEKFCIEKYGDEYKRYMQKAPRYFLIKK